MPPFPGEILIPGSTWAACLSALSWTLGLSSFINSKSIITCLRNTMYGDLLPDFPGKGESSTEGWGVTWEILGSDWGCHRRNLGKYIATFMVHCCLPAFVIVVLKTTWSGLDLFISLVFKTRHLKCRSEGVHEQHYAESLLSLWYLRQFWTHDPGPASA